MSRLASRSRVVFSSAPVAAWKRRLNSSWRASASFSPRSSSFRLRSWLALKEIRLPFHELGLHRQLAPGEAQRLLRERLGDAGQLEHDAARLDDGDPVLGRALARAHARLGRLLGHRLVREDVDPALAAALDLARHRDTSGLDLAVRHPADLERLQAVVAEVDGRLAGRLAGAAAGLDLAELGLLGKQHRLALAARLVELRRVLGLCLRCGRVRRVRDGLRRRLDVRLDRRLLAPPGGGAALVGARPLDLAAPALAALAALAAGASRPAPAATGAARPASAPAGPTCA